MAGRHPSPLSSLKRPLFQRYLVDEVEEVWGHKSIVYARAPPSFQARYFTFRSVPVASSLPLCRLPTLSLPMPTTSALSLNLGVDFPPAPMLPPSALPWLALGPRRPLESAVVAALAHAAAPITVFGAFTRVLAPATLQGLAAGLPHLHHLPRREPARRALQRLLLLLLLREMSCWMLHSDSIGIGLYQARDAVAARKHRKPYKPWVPGARDSAALASWVPTASSWLNT
ncbi:hypothetical protein DFH11DRAFT_1731450 [Phellopilus nigrolimitatus]|nr:hypothetical protein DFH11DRAFT_1731450 [Phellopilus nigrolimitatus]